MTEEVLQDICSHFGTVKEIELVCYPGTKKLKGVAYVQFSDKEEVKGALECLAPGKKMPSEEKEDET